MGRKPKEKREPAEPLFIEVDSNNKVYFALNSLKDKIQHLKKELVKYRIVEAKAIKRSRKNMSMLDTIEQALIKEKDKKTTNMIKKYKIEYYLKEIAILRKKSYWLVENFIHFIKNVQVDILYNSDSYIMIDEIKEKIRNAIESFNGSWKYFEQRIWTDIKRIAVKNYRKRTFYESKNKYDIPSDVYEYRFRNSDYYSPTMGEYANYTPESLLLLKERTGELSFLN